MLTKTANELGTSDGSWYVAAMNDGYFVIDHKPQPAPVDYACDLDHGVNVIAVCGSNRELAEMLAAEHNARLTRALVCQRFDHALRNALEQLEPIDTVKLGVGGFEMEAGLVGKARVLLDRALSRPADVIPAGTFDDRVLDALGTAYVNAYCRRCGIKRPNHCDCEDTFIANDDVELRVDGCGHVSALRTEEPARYTVMVRVRDKAGRVTWELDLDPETALRFADRVRRQAVQAVRDNVGDEPE